MATKIKNSKKVCTCSSCDKQGKEQPLGNFYSTSLTDIFDDSKIPICKSCCATIFEERGFDGFKDIMKLINKPIYMDLFKGDYGEYIKNVNSLPNYKLNTYDDSTLFEEPKIVASEKMKIIEHVEVDDEIIAYWGKGYIEEEYEYLENEKIKLITSFECPDYGMEMIMKDICFINLEIEKIRQERRENNQKTLTNLIETRSKLMNDANMKPIQSSGAEGNDQVTFGTLIKKWENERPIPKPVDDEMKRYIDTFMVGHLAKMEGLNNDMTKLYDEAMSEYTVKFEDIHKFDDEFDD